MSLRLRRPSRTGRLLAFLAALAILLLPPRTPASWASEPDPVGVWPLQPPTEVVAGFDPPADPWGAGHRGVDLQGVPGQPVRTALAGQVAYAGLLAGRGVVVVDHGETRTTYEPVAALVAVGDVLARGAVIGDLQAVGSHCPPQACLHWGWLRGDEYLDPLGLVGGGPVRLLPLWREDPLPLPASFRYESPDPATTTSFAVGPYAAVLARLDRLTRSGFGRLGRSPPSYARGCACW